MNYTVKLKSGDEAINGEHYIFDEENKLFKVTYYHLIIDFSNCNNITFDIGYNHILKCGDNCTILIYNRYNELYIGKNCLIKDLYRDNIIHSCKENCQAELYDGGKLINKILIPTNYSIKTNNSKLGFEIIKVRKTI